MGEAAGRTGTAEIEDTPVRRLPEDTIADILLRLPARAVLRSGAACKAWRCITTAPRFLAERARRQQPAASVLVSTHLPGAPWPHLALDALPVSPPEDGGRQRLIRYPNTPLCERPHCLLLASCDGVLLFSTGAGGYLLCNPVTRQWAELPRLPDEYAKEIDTEYAFYVHRPSGEFRLLCCSLRRRAWYIVSTAGAAEPRHLNASNPDPGLMTGVISSLFMGTSTPVPLHGNLHWPPVCCGSVAGETRIVVFNTASETFHLMPGPTSTTPKMMKLFEMDGLLAAADFGEEKHVDLWFLEDYGAGRWARRHRVDSPWKHGKGRPRKHWKLLQSVAAAADGQGNVILGNSDGLAVYDVRKETMRAVDSVMQREYVSGHVFKGSLVQHACFASPASADVPFTHSWS